MRNATQSAFEDSTSSPPNVFSQYGLSTAFLVNFWDTFTSLMILLGSVLVLCFFHWLAKKYISKKFYLTATVSEYVKICVQNLLVSQFFSSYDDISLFCLLQFRQSPNNTILSVLDYVVASCFLLFACIGIILLVKVLQESQQIRKKCSGEDLHEAMKKFEHSYACMRVLFADFRFTSFIHQAFVLFQIMRSLAYSCILTMLFEYPLAQSASFVTISCVMVVYVVTKNPFRSRLDFVQQITFELLILVANCSLLGLAILDRSEGRTYQAFSKEELSNSIVFLNIIASLLPLAFLLPKLIHFCYRFFRWMYTILKERRGIHAPSEVVKIDKIEDNSAMVFNKSSNDPSNHVSVMKRTDLMKQDNSIDIYLEGDSAISNVELVKAPRVKPINRPRMVFGT